MELAKPLNKYIDHTLLNPEAKNADFEKLLDEAIKYNFRTVCVPSYIAVPIKQALNKEGADTKVCTVIDFPHGQSPLKLKISQALTLAKAGVDEIDWVLNYANLRSGLYEETGTELEHMGSALHNVGAISKCIVETCYLDSDQKQFVLEAINNYTPIDYIKTSTGFGSAGAHLGDVLHWNSQIKSWGVKEAGNLIQLTPVGGRMKALKIKAAGGIRDLNTALKFIAAGADRLGMSASVKVMEEYLEQQNIGEYHG